MKEIPIRKGTAAWVDAPAFEAFGYNSWRLDAKGRPVRDGNPFVGCKGSVRLDAMILGTHAGEKIIHLNNVALDCRRENLAIVDHRFPQRIGAHRLNMNAIVLRALRTFPSFREGCHVGNLRVILENVWGQSGLTVEAFLERVEGWAATNSTVTPWTLEKPAPRLVMPASPEPIPTAPLPNPSARQKAVTRATLRPWEGDGTE